MVATSVRNADLSDLAALLKEQHAAKVDVVAPASTLRMDQGVLTVEGSEAVLTDEGVTQGDGRYLPTAVFDEGLADKLKIPVGYLRRMRSERPDLYDLNVNGWLHGQADSPVDKSGPGYDPDPRSFLVRCFTGGTAGVGVARAFLSDKYARIDNFDVLTAALDGVRQAGTPVEIEGCDLTDRRMYVRLAAPEIKTLAPVLLRNYRSPFSDPAIEVQRNHGWSLEQGRVAAAREGKGYTPGDEPVVSAGLVITNSETGNGAWTVVPRLRVEACRNGLVINVDALRAVHLGARLDEGIVRWTPDTQSKALALVTAKTRDAVATFLDVDYITAKVAEIEVQAGTRVTSAAQTVTLVGRKLQFDEATTAGVLDHFIRGGDLTAGGVLSAVTSYAQVIGDADAAFAVESKGLEALTVAAAAG